MEDGSIVVLYVAGASDGDVEDAVDAITATGDVSVLRATDVEAARETLRRRTVDCAVVEYPLPDADGLGFLESLDGTHPDVPFVLYAEEGDDALAAEAVRRGAVDYLWKDDGRHGELAERVSVAAGTGGRRGTVDEELRQFRDAVAESRVWVTVFGPDGDVTMWNRGAEAISGYDAEEVLGHDRVWEWLYPDDEYRAEVLAVTREVSEGERTLEEWETTIRTAEGEERVISWYSRAVTDSDGRLAGSVAVGRDVTDRRKRERELRRRELAETRYRSLFENNPIVIWEEDLSAAKEYVDTLAEEVDDLTAYLDDNPEELVSILDRVEIIDVNQNALDHYGAESKSELIENLDRMMTEETFEAESNRDMWVSIAEGETRYRAETVSRTLDGDRRHEILDLYVPEAYAEDYSRAYITATDITERKRYEQRLKEQRDGLETLNEMLRHDIRNDLQVVTAHADLLADDLPEETDAREHVDAIRENTEHAIEFTATAREMADVMTRSGDEQRHVDLRRTLRQEVEEVRSAHTDAVVTVDGTVPRTDVVADDMLSSVFRNLLQNAVQHNDEDPVEVTVSAVEREETVVVRVADNGPGVPEDRTETVFERGERSPSSRGTGTGLYLVRTLVESYDGDVWVEDSDEGGAEFVVELPTGE